MDGNFQDSAQLSLAALDRNQLNKLLRACTIKVRPVPADTTIGIFAMILPSNFSPDDVVNLENTIEAATGSQKVKGCIKLVSPVALLYPTNNELELYVEAALKFEPEGL